MAVTTDGSPIKITDVTELKESTGISDNDLIITGINGTPELRQIKFSSIMKKIINIVYPVGSIYFSVKNVNPGTFLGGTWVAWGTGRVPVGVDPNNSNFNAVEKTGGAVSINLGHSHTMAHTHTVQAHKHLQTVGSDDGKGLFLKTGIGPYGSVVENANVNVLPASSMSYSANSPGRYHYTASASPKTDNGTRTATDTSLASNVSILQPYITCYIWKRTT